MMNTIIEISAYIFIAILLGLFFGWLITKILLKEKYQKDFNEVSEELVAYKKDYKLLKAQSKELNFRDDDFKDELIATLTTKLSHSEEKQMEVEKKHEEEIDAFMFERIDITQRYKELLENFNLLIEDKTMVQDKASWFSKLFSSSSPTIH